MVSCLYFISLPILADEKGNEALNKSLEGKTDKEKFQIKGILELSFTTSIKQDSVGNIERTKLDTLDISKSETIARFEAFMKGFKKNSSFDTTGNDKVVDKFLQLYKADYSPLDIKA